ncbi:toll/interleukin-1 receptor domain-containing protein [Leifsonia sp. NCR5]|uniref:toll/interleukin-1 receptor domain-containing protein n=1 Tax=Leifsonia sp. NCR5 TaxID=1978342 RepID=UPI000A18A913|nr:toll/interleukin-1 receptor domain-containing protein [Leifsonia sp. NCR5]
MAQCTAPIRGHTRGGGADCPVHGGRYGRYGGGYRDPYNQRPSYTPPPAPVTPPLPKRYPSFSRSSSGSRAGGGRRTSTASRARRSEVTYSVREYQTLNPVRAQVARIAEIATAQRDLFLCHAWDDRKGAALELHNLLTGLDVSVWFSEMDVPLGTSLIRKIDKGLAASRAGIVLVTPALFASLNSDGIASQELSALLATDRVIPIVHGTTFEELRRVSPLLAARSGLTTSDYASLDEVATKIADTVLLDDE